MLTFLLIMNEIFIKKANKVHCNKYDYSLTNYVNSKTNITIICQIHGEFVQKPNGHLSGKGCSKCAIANSRLTTKTFIERSINIHGNKYNYSLTEYKGSYVKTSIICNLHGVFEQTPRGHLTGRGCKLCSYNDKKSDIDSFIIRANKTHNNFYDYSLVDYINGNSKIKIICPNHGMFEQVAQFHLRGQGCSICNKVKQGSKAEKEVIDYIKTIYKDSLEENNRFILNGKELDIYLPKLNLAIEYNGYYWHKRRELENPGYHKLKAKLCKDLNIKLVNIVDKSWINNKELVQEKIKRKINEQIIS